MRTTLGLLPLIALSAALTGPAHSQDGSGQAPEGEVTLDEISVVGAGSGTGYKRERLQSPKATAPLVDTPRTVTVIPEEVIEERGATDLVEVLRNTPGISFDAGENAFGSGGGQIFLRGMNANNSIFVDGARDNGFQTRDTFNVEQVEVVKGAAADNGRGVGAGYINLVTKTPMLDEFIRASTRVGFDDDGRSRARGSVDVNQVVDNFAFRFNGMAEGGDIFGRDLADADAWGIAPSLAYGLGTDFRAILAYEHVERGGLPDSGVPINRTDPLFGVAIKGAGDRPFQGNRPRDFFFGSPTGYDDTTSDAFLARFEYDATDWLTISNQTRWSRLDRDADYRLAGSGASLDGSIAHILDRVNETLTNQTNLTAEFDTGSWRHTLSTGLEFSRETADAVRGGGAQTSAVEVETVAAYLYDTIELSDRWLLNGGLRVESYSVDIESSTNDIPGAGRSYSDSVTTVGGNLGVVYKIRPEGSLYASYGVSHQPHGSLLSNPDISRTGANAFPGFVANADPVEAHNYEVGVKWDFFGGDLAVTGALFHTEKRKVAYPSAAGPVYGRQVIRGAELGIAGNITPAWSVFGGVTLLDTERRHGSEVDNALRTAADYGAALTTSGDELAYTPNFTASLWTTYRWNDRLTLGGGVQYASESWIGRPDDALRVIKNGRYGVLPEYFLVNLMASYDFNDNITLRFNIDNVLDETYLTTANWNASWGYLGAPRTYRFGTSLRF